MVMMRDNIFNSLTEQERRVILAAVVLDGKNSGLQFGSLTGVGNGNATLPAVNWPQEP